MSSETQLQVGEFKLWRVDDGASSWVAARTEEEAFSFYRKEFLLDEDWEVEVYPSSEISFYDEDDHDKTYPASEMMKDLGAPAIIACSEY